MLSGSLRCHFGLGQFLAEDGCNAGLMQHGSDAARPSRLKFFPLEGFFLDAGDGIPLFFPGNSSHEAMHEQAFALWRQSAASPGFWLSGQNRR